MILECTNGKDGRRKKKDRPKDINLSSNTYDSGLNLLSMDFLNEVSKNINDMEKKERKKRLF
jgi:hypothetical protein